MVIEKLVCAEVFGHDACGGGGGLCSAFLEKGLGDQHPLGLHALALLLGVVFGKRTGQAAVLGMCGDGLHDADAAFQVGAAIVHGFASGAALGVLHELGTLLLAFQVGDGGFQAIERGLLGSVQAAVFTLGGVQQGAGFGHLGGLLLADFVEFHGGVSNG